MNGDAGLILRADLNRPLSSTDADNNIREISRRTRHGWNDLVSDVNVKPGSPNAPTMQAYRDGLYGVAFDPDIPQEVFANFHIRHDYVPGTMIYPHIHWSVNTTSTGTIRWGIEYTWARRGDSSGQTSYPATNTMYYSVNINSPMQYFHGVSESPEGSGIPGSTIEVDTLIKCRFFRAADDPLDTFPDFVFIDTVDIHYESDVLSTPLRRPPFYS